jgi:hypothetical protein
MSNFGVPWFPNKFVKRNIKDDKQIIHATLGNQQVSELAATNKAHKLCLRASHSLYPHFLLGACTSVSHIQHKVVIISPCPQISPHKHEKLIV